MLPIAVRTIDHSWLSNLAAMDEYKAKHPVDVGIYLKVKRFEYDICEIFDGEASRTI